MNIIVRYFWYQLFDFDDEAAPKGYTSRASRETYLSFRTGWAYNGGKSPVRAPYRIWVSSGSDIPVGRSRKIFTSFAAPVCCNWLSTKHHSIDCRSMIVVITIIHHAHLTCQEMLVYLPVPCFMWAEKPQITNSEEDYVTIFTTDGVVGSPDRHQGCQCLGAGKAGYLTLLGIWPSRSGYGRGAGG